MKGAPQVRVDLGPAQSNAECRVAAMNLGRVQSRLNKAAGILHNQRDHCDRKVNEQFAVKQRDMIVRPPSGSHLLTSPGSSSTSSPIVPVRHDPLGRKPRKTETF